MTKNRASDNPRHDIRFYCGLPGPQSVDNHFIRHGEQSTWRNQDDCRYRAVKPTGGLRTT